LNEATRIPKYFSISGSAYYFHSDLLQGRADNAGTRPMTAVNGRISIERRRTKQGVLIFFSLLEKEGTNFKYLKTSHRMYLCDIHDVILFFSLLFILFLLIHFYTVIY